MALYETQTTGPSVSTTYVVQENSALNLNADLNKSLTALEAAVADYGPVVTDIRYVLGLKCGLVTRTGELERLNAENNELVLQIVAAVQERDLNVFLAQIEQVMYSEQQRLLLNAARKAQASASGDGNGLEQLQHQNFEQLIYKPFQGRRLTKRQAVGLMGQLDRRRDVDAAC